MGIQYSFHYFYEVEACTVYHAYKTRLGLGFKADYACILSAMKGVHAVNLSFVHPVVLFVYIVVLNPNSKSGLKMSATAFI